MRKSDTTTESLLQFIFMSELLQDGEYTFKMLKAEPGQEKSQGEVPVFLLTCSFVPIHLTDVHWALLGSVLLNYQGNYDTPSGYLNKYHTTKIGYISNTTTLWFDQ